tara:strand:- start:259 stop:1188 length:930 start_codon:yes stop_codon:yes gene_type:complete
MVTLRTNVEEVSGAVLQFWEDLDDHISTNLLPSIGRSVIETFQETLLENYRRSNKGSGTIMFSGDTGRALGLEYWSMALDDFELHVAWNPPEDLLSLHDSDSGPFAKLWAIDFGTPPPQEQHPVYQFSNATVEDTRRNADWSGYTEGPFRQHVRAWIAEKGLNVRPQIMFAYLMGDNIADMEEERTDEWLGGSKGADPSFLMGSKPPAIFEESFDSSGGSLGLVLNSTGIDLLAEAIERAIQKVPLPTFRKIKGRRKLTQSIIVATSTRINRIRRVDPQGNSYTLHQAVVVNRQGRIIKHLGSARVYDF